MTIAATALTLGTDYASTDSSVTVRNDTSGADHAWPLCSFNVTYSYNIGGSARNASGFGITGVVTMAEFIPTIAIVAVAAIVISIILIFFGRKKEEGL